MSRDPQPPEDDVTLFDLPLHRSDPRSGEPVPSAPKPAEAIPDDDEPFRPLPEAPLPEAGTRLEAPNISFAMTLPFESEADEHDDVTADESQEAPMPVPAGVGSLLLAGLVDIGLIFVGMVAAVLGAATLGSPPGPQDWPAVVVLGLTLSFPYYVVPLAFWGRSAGMAAFSLFCRSSDGRPLSFRQAVLRWLAALVTMATLGLALLVALSGRSLADRLSGAHTRTR